MLYGVKEVKDVTILICGHGGRDMRCGVLGPLLRKEFENTLPQEGFQVLKGPVEIEQPGSQSCLGSDGAEAEGA